MNCRQLNDKWLTFDCYGTLLDWQTAFRRLLGPEVVDAYHELEPAIQADMPGARYKDVLREAAVRLELDDRDVLVNGWSSIGPFADTPAALTALRAAGWKLGILTNCDVDLFESTRAALGVPIDLVVTAEEVGAYKPSLEHFTRFEAVTGVERANWVHAAVSWWHDMVPARELGLRSVWVDRERTRHDASIVTFHVHDMAGVPGVLA